MQESSMTPLIDLDLLLYEVCYACTYEDEETGEKRARHFDDVAQYFDTKINEICEEVWATDEPILFITVNREIHEAREKVKAKKAKYYKKKGKDIPVEYLPTEYKPNFRVALAVSKEYKGNRKQEKPEQWMNLYHYVVANYDVCHAVGIEADDAMAILQDLENFDTVICTRDKDLRMVEGNHFGWHTTISPQYGPKMILGIGELELGDKGLKGTGLKFFYSQLITGDTCDNYAGIPRQGPVKAYNLLNDLETEKEMFEAVLEAYTKYYGDDARVKMKETVDLAWMIRELDEDGEPVLHVLYDER